MRFPSVDDWQEGIPGVVFGEIFDTFQGVDRGEVSEGKDVGALEDEDEIYVDRPVTDTFQDCEGGANIIVGAFGERLQVCPSAYHRFSQISYINSLLAAKIASFQLVVGKPEDVLWGDFPKPFAKLIQSR